MNASLITSITSFFVWCTVVALSTVWPSSAAARGRAGEPSTAQIVRAFAKQGIRINGAEGAGIRPNVLLALKEARANGIGNSKVDFAAVEIGHDLGLDIGSGSNTVKNIVAALNYLLKQPVRPLPVSPPKPNLQWVGYFDDVTNLWNQPKFMRLVAEKGFSPVKISWEDIGRDQNSSWGDRISDVGIWVRRDEKTPRSARLALSVRRDHNFSDKVLMVPANKIKIHQRMGGRTVEKTLPERLKELKLASARRDRNVIVSNQFAIVPVPARHMRGAWPSGVSPRVAFNFSIFPYGSTNYVITDVIEGSHEAIVGPGSHQLLFANLNGKKAPFTASRAEDRLDLLKLEKELKAKGMDVDVQRYYLIQIPIKKGALGIRLSNMGTPPINRGWGASPSPLLSPSNQMQSGGLSEDKGVGAGANMALPSAKVAKSAPSAQESVAGSESNTLYSARAKKEKAGLAKVAIGTGDKEGRYFGGTGFRGARADEPIRVTVVYFVTPVGKVTRKDMETFAQAFAQWDRQAIWGGSFVTKETK